MTRNKRHRWPDYTYLVATRTDGREGVLTGNDREHAEVSMLALHLLQSSLVFINTQLLQAVLRDPAWAG